MTKPLFIMMAGLPYSGKSVHANYLSEKYNAVIHSSDSIRAELFGDVQDQEHNPKVFETLHQRVRDDLSNGKNVIYDATNLSYKRRMSTLQYLSKTGCEKVCMFMATPFDEIVERSKHRDRVVPYEVLERMYKSIWIPNTYEGWDNVELVYPHDFVMDGALKLLTSLRSIPHDNPHHSQTIGDHCISVANILYDKGASIELRVAGFLHDIGKPFTKSFLDSKGNPSEIAHYYGHHHVSAYDSLFYILFDYVDTLHVATIINWHMRPYEIEKSPNPERLCEKFKSLVGERIYNDVMTLHEADLEAH